MADTSRHLYVHDGMLLLNEQDELIEIKYDEDCESPRDEGEDLGTFYTWSNRYGSPDGDNGRAPDLYDLARELHVNLNKCEGHPIPYIAKALTKKGYVALPVSKLEHSGIAYATGSPSQFLSPYNYFDAEYIGIIYATPKQVQEYAKELGVKKAAAAERLAECLKGEVEEYSEWADGDAYYFHVYDRTGEEIDSRGGFIGDDATKNGMEDVVGRLRESPYRSVDEYVQDMSARWLADNWRSEIAKVDLREDTITNHVIKNLMAQRMLDDEGAGYTLEDMVSFIEQNNVRGISKDSLLYDKLVEWYGDKDTMLDNVRYAMEDGDNLYWFHGNGYSVYDQNLLGGTGDGEAEKRFEEFLKKDLTVVKPPRVDDEMER